jgi:hypothetical protein
MVATPAKTALFLLLWLLVVVVVVVVRATTATWNQFSLISFLRRASRHVMSVATFPAHALKVTGYRMRTSQCYAEEQVARSKGGFRHSKEDVRHSKQDVTHLTLINKKPIINSLRELSN